MAAGRAWAWQRHYFPHLPRSLRMKLILPLHEFMMELSCLFLLDIYLSNRFPCSGVDLPLQMCQMALATLPSPTCVQSKCSAVAQSFTSHAHRPDTRSPSPRAFPGRPAFYSAASSCSQSLLLASMPIPNRLACQCLPLTLPFTLSHLYISSTSFQ